MDQVDSGLPLSQTKKMRRRGVSAEDFSWSGLEKNVYKC